MRRQSGKGSQGQGGPVSLAEAFADTQRRIRNGMRELKHVQVREG